MRSLPSWLLLCTVAFAQTPLASLPPSPAERPLLVDDRGPDILVSGNTFKASFTADGVTVIPRTGHLGPSTPIGFRTRAVTSGGEPLPLAAGPFTFAADRCERRGAAFTERYDVATTQLEQSFVFEQLPTRGELLVDVAVTTTLQVTSHDDGRALHFDDDVSHLVLDRAVAIDAAGTRCELALQWRGDGYRLAVPAAFVASATLPLVVDPVLVSRGLTISSRPAAQSDVAWSPLGGLFMAVWEDQVTTTDTDLVGRPVNGDGVTLAFQFIDLTTASPHNPAIAYDLTSNRFLVVAEESFQSITDYLLNGANGQLLVARFEISGPATTSQNACGAPDVGGNDMVGNGGGTFQVVWTNGGGSQSTVYARQVGSSSALQPLSPPLIGASAAPAISQSRRGTDRWFVVAQFGAVQSFQQVAGISLHLAGVPIGNPALLQPTGNSGRQPDVSPPIEVTPGTHQHLVTCHTPNAGQDILGILVTTTATGPNAGAPTNLIQLETTDPVVRNELQIGSRVTTDGATYFVTYQTMPTGRTDFDTRGSFWQAMPNGTLRLLDGRIPLAVSLDNERDGAVAAAPSLQRFGAVECRTSNGPVNDIDFQLLNATGPLQRATGCGGLGATAIGTSVPGGLVQFQLSGATLLNGFLAGPPASLPLAGCGSCVLGVGALNLVSNPFALVIPNNFALVGAQLSVQGFDFGVGTCSGGFRLGDTFDVTVR